MPAVPRTDQPHHGPLGLGTQLSVLVAVAAGVSARSAFLWVSAGTIVWSVIAAGLTVAGVSFVGVGVDADAVALPGNLS